MSLSWYGCQLACATCGATADLVVDASIPDPGEDEYVSVLLCPAGHRGDHPLLYLTAVTALAEEDTRTQQERLDALGWWPHFGNSIHDGRYGDLGPVPNQIDYRPWTNSTFEALAASWPDLHAASRRAAAAGVERRR